jgi:hypothetical protein
MPPDNTNRKLQLTSWFVRAIFRHADNAFYAELEEIPPPHASENVVAQRANADFRQPDPRSFDLMVGG